MSVVLASFFSMLDIKRQLDMCFRSSASENLQCSLPAESQKHVAASPMFAAPVSQLPMLKRREAAGRVPPLLPV